MADHIARAFHVPETPFTTRPTLQGTFGMVSSTHWLASQCAMAVLEDGGNAFDAAVAAGFVLHVVEPHLNGPAGEVPILLAPAGGAARVLCGQGPAPAGATAAHYRSLGLDLVPGTGPLAAAVPGAFDAWMLLLRDHGTKPLADVLKYAIGYAEDGHPPVERVGETVEGVRALFESEWHSSAEVYLPGGRAPCPGRLLRNPALARTWRRLLEESASTRASVNGDGRVRQIEAARRVWREGFVAEALVAQAHRPTLDTSGEHHTGTLAAADLAGWSATYEDPVTYDWNGWTVCKAGGWSQGPAFLQQLALLPDELPPYGSAEYVHLLVEGCKLAMADREAWYGDAAQVPLAELLSDDYNAARRALVGAEASYELRPGSPGGRPPRIAREALRARGSDTDVRAVGAGEPTVAANGATRGDTCHLDLVDRWGNMVAATPSGGWLQSNPVVPELGFPLGTRLQMAWLEEGLPNTLTPGRRPVRHCRPPWRCATAYRCWRSARPAGTSRTSGSCTSSSPSPSARASAAASVSRARSTPRTGTTTPSRARSTHGRPGPAASRSRRGPTGRWWRGCGGADTGSRSAAPGRRGGCARSPATRGPGSCPPPPIRAGCRGTRWGADAGRPSTSPRCRPVLGPRSSIVSGACFAGRMIEGLLAEFLEDRSSHVEEAVRKAAAVEIMPRFRQLAAHEVLEKSGPHDLVTVADRRAEEFLTQALTELLPGSAVVGEEAVAADPSVYDALGGDAPVWIVDPVDGTRQFVRGEEGFCTLVALAHRGEVLASWTYGAALDVMAVAVRGRGATFNGAAIRSGRSRPAR